MTAHTAEAWVEGYLYRARHHRALEQSVLAEGGRHGFSERSLSRASASLGLNTQAGCWELAPDRVAARNQRELAELTQVPTRSFTPALRRRIA
jgi:hypothetical protein